jgi:ABC-type nitrate/sulfonate/bicarbonate transport system permease component
MMVRRLWPALVLVVLLLLAWELYVRVSGISPFVLPAPTRVLSALIEFRDDALRHTSVTLGETLVGFGLSVAGAVAAAVVMDWLPPVRRAVYPLLVGSQTIPIVAIAPLLVIWFGFGLLPKVVVIVLVTFFPVTVALLDGFARTSPEATELLETLGASRWQVFAKLRWPAALPYLFTGLRIAAVYAVVGAIFGEYVGAFAGLGIWMAISQNAFRTDLVFGAIFIAALLSIGLFLLIGLLERLVIPWSVALRRDRRSEG